MMQVIFFTAPSLSDTGLDNVLNEFTRHYLADYSKFIIEQRGFDELRASCAAVDTQYRKLLFIHPRYTSFGTELGIDAATGGYEIHRFSSV